MPRTCASDAPETMTKESVAEHRPRRSNTTGSTALRSINAFTTCESSVFILEEHPPGADAGVRGDHRSDRGHQTLYGSVARHELNAQRFREFRDVAVHDAHAEGARPRREGLVEQLEDAAAGRLTAARAPHVLVLTFHSKRHDGFEIELRAQPGLAAAHASGADQPLRTRG